MKATGVGRRAIGLQMVQNIEIGWRHHVGIFPFCFLVPKLQAYTWRRGVKASCVACTQAVLCSKGG